MNTVESYSILSPNHKTEECAKFSIDDTSQVFAINDVMVVGREYTFSCWLRSDVMSSLIVGEETFSSTTEWTYVKHTFVADRIDLYFAFGNTGVYYMHHAQLELGNKATDWDVAPEDVDANIDETNKYVSDLNETAVEAWNNANTAGQAAGAAQATADTAKGDAAKAQGRADDAWDKAAKAQQAAENANKDELDDLWAALGELESAKQNAGAVETLIGYVDVKLEGPDAPYIELGDRNLNNIAKLRLTNNELRFMDNTYKVAWMTAQKLYIENARIIKELEIGEFSWTEHATKHETVNGTEVLVRSRTGLLWRGGN